MNFVLVFKFLSEKLRANNIDFALMGGFALQSAGITRTTMDIDLLILRESSFQVKEIMLKHRYKLIHESDDVLNFISDDFQLGKVLPSSSGNKKLTSFPINSSSSYFKSPLVGFLAFYDFYEYKINLRKKQKERY